MVVNANLQSLDFYFFILTAKAQPILPVHVYRLHPIVALKTIYYLSRETCAQHLAVGFLIIGSDILPVKFNTVTAIFGNPAANVGNERRQGFFGGGDSLKIAFSFHTTNGNNQLHVVFLGHLSQGLEVFGVIFVSESQRTIFGRKETHVVDLTDSTIDANARFFASRDDVPRYAVTMGVGDIMRAKRLLLIINGSKEDAASQLLLGDRITPRCPVTLMKIHPDATVLIDRALADKIGYKG